MKTYEVFKNNNLNPEGTSKDWRDAFIESFAGIRNTCLKDNFSNADCLYVHTSINSCTSLAPLIAYVYQFEQGRFWYSKDCGLHFTTSGLHSDKDATYNDALVFCANWETTKRVLMRETLTKQQLKRLTKKQLVNMAEYRNIKEFCAYNQYLVRSAKKAPSKKDIINYIL